MFNIFSSAKRVKEKTEKHLLAYSSPTLEFFLLIALASTIITAGLLLDNTSVIIGGMVVAPLITPFFGFSLSLILFKPKDIFKSLSAILLGSICAVLTAGLTSYGAFIIHHELITNTTEILSRTKPNILYFIVAILSGVIGTYAYRTETMSEKIMGIAISSAIVPPLSVVGIGIAKMDPNLIESSFILFVVNFIGICFGSIITFIFLGFGKEKLD